jgi:hypothetical protein
LYIRVTSVLPTPQVFGLKFYKHIIRNPYTQMLHSVYERDTCYSSLLDHPINVSERRCMRLFIIQLYSSCCFLFLRALPCLRPLVADPCIRTPGFRTEANPFGICGRECVIGTSFFLSTSGFLCHYHSTIFHLHTFHSPSMYYMYS